LSGHCVTQTVPQMLYPLMQLRQVKLSEHVAQAAEHG